MQRRSERGSQLEHRVRDNVYHQRRTAPITIGDRPEQQRSHRPHRQRQENSLEDGGNLRVELRGDGPDAKSQYEKIEGIQRPSQKAGNERIALRRSQTSKMRQKFYRPLLRKRSSPVSPAHAISILLDH